MKRILAFFALVLALCAFATVEWPPGEPHYDKVGAYETNKELPATVLEELDAGCPEDLVVNGDPLGFDPGYATTEYVVPEPPDFPARLMGVAEKFAPDPMPGDAFHLVSRVYAVQLGDPPSTRLPTHGNHAVGNELTPTDFGSKEVMAPSWGWSLNRQV